MAELEENIVVTMCKLEMIFPPGFFDCGGILYRRDINLLCHVLFGGSMYEKQSSRSKSCLGTLT